MHLPLLLVLLALLTNLIISYSRNLRLLFKNETSILERVTQGDLSHKVPVVTKDEFGVIAGHTNNMIDGLRHRTELIGSLHSFQGEAPQEDDITLVIAKLL